MLNLNPPFIASTSTSTRRHKRFLWTCTGLVLLLSSVLAWPCWAQPCGTERWSVKTGTDAQAQLVNLTSPQVARIVDLIALPAPNPIPKTTRVQPTETTVFVVDATLTDYKQESGAHGDSDYHLVLKDDQGNTMVAEIPSPGCVRSGSPFTAQISNARAVFDSKLSAGSSFQTANIPVRVTGVGFFDFAHGQRGAAPNVIELHPVLDIAFNPGPENAPSVAATGNAMAPAGAASTGTQNWEYTVVTGATEQEVVNQANLSGANGWELVSVVNASSGHGYTGFLKRRRQ